MIVTIGAVVTTTTVKIIIRMNILGSLSVFEYVSIQRQNIFPTDRARGIVFPLPFNPLLSTLNFENTNIADNWLFTTTNLKHHVLHNQSI